MLVNNVRDGKRNLLIIDEAHTITDPDVFEELRLLLNFQTTESYLMTLFLMGQPELKERIQKNKQFLQRIPMAFQLDPLKPEEVAKYIQHRLTVAGAGRPIFTEQAMEAVATASGGIPRRINQICDFSLALGFFKQTQQITPEIVEEALTSSGL